MVKLTKEDVNKLGQILKELNEMKNVLKGGEGSGVKGHKTPKPIITRTGTKELNETYNELKRRKKLGIYNPDRDKYTDIEIDRTPAK